MSSSWHLDLGSAEGHFVSPLGYNFLICDTSQPSPITKVDFLAFIVIVVDIRSIPKDLLGHALWVLTIQSLKWQHLKGQVPA